MLSSQIITLRFKLGADNTFKYHFPAFYLYIGKSLEPLTWRKN